MLLTDFYKINTLNKVDNQKYSVDILINEKHQVFKGHFPENPIMPGVCMMQIIKEIAEQIAECNLVLQTLSNVNFMALINPNVSPELRLELDISGDQDIIKVKNTTLFGETVALKLSGVYKRVA